MDSLFPMNVQSDDFINCLDLQDGNATDEMMWLSSDLLNYEPVLNDCMLSGDVPMAMQAEDIILSNYKTEHDRVMAFITDQDIEQDLLTLVNPNMAMTLEKECRVDDSAIADSVMTEVALVPKEEPQECIVEDATPASTVPTILNSSSGTHPTYVLTYRPAKNSLLKPQQHVAVSPQLQVPAEASEKTGQTPSSQNGMQKVQIRLMPRGTNNRMNGASRSPESNCIKGLPLSPPNSDSDGSLSPVRCDKPSVTQNSMSQSYSPQRPKLTNVSLLSNSMASSGLLILSEEEERTLISEGYPVPTKLPLTKQEEKILKKIQRKIKNKVSAQESRRKKKDYIDNLEKRLEASNQENSSLKKKKVPTATLR